jgi:MoxR-like ATPase
MNIADIRKLNEQIETESIFQHELLAEINKVMVGQETMVERVLIGLLADGHILLEGVPGLAKTLLIKTMSEAIQAEFSRSDRDSDLQPAQRRILHSPGSALFQPHPG